MTLPTGDKVLILGASRGLGAAFYKQFVNSDEEVTFLLASRKQPLDVRSHDKFYCFDASQVATWPGLFEKIDSFKPQRCFYFPGGGPYGFFHEKKMSDHLWAVRVNFEFPMHLIHHLLNSEYCSQAVFVGSAVAEKPDPKAASYAAGKAGLKNLILTIAQENNKKDLRLFSPSYMDTQMLPKNAEIRTNNTKILDCDTTAKDLLKWVQKPNDGSPHFIYD